MGDLVNPVYNALNGLVGTPQDPTPFPSIDNEEIRFLRDREQETRIRLTQVLWNGSVRDGIDVIIPGPVC